MVALSTLAPTAEKELLEGAPTAAMEFIDSAYGVLATAPAWLTVITVTFACCLLGYFGVRAIFWAASAAVLMWLLAAPWWAFAANLSNAAERSQEITNRNPKSKIQNPKSKI